MREELLGVAMFGLRILQQKIDFLKFSHRRLMSMQTAQNLWDPRPDKQYSTERALFIGKNDWM